MTDHHEVESPSEKVARFTHTIQQIADQYGVNPRTIRRWIKSGRIDAIRVGPRLIRLDPNAVAEQLIGGGHV